jgi:hypothetical protein
LESSIPGPTDRFIFFITELVHTCVFFVHVITDSFYWNVITTMVSTTVY